jgi:hypothetical protein
MACLWGFALILLSLELHFLHASFPGGKLAEATQMLARLDLLGAGRILASNVTQGAVRYFASPEDGSFYLVARYIFLAATIYCLFLGFGRSQPPLIAAGMAGLAFFIALLALYDVGEWRDLRSLAGITVFSIVILGQHRRRLFLFSALLVQLTVYPALMDYRAQFNGQRVMPFINQMDGAGEQISAYKALSTLPNTRDNQKFILLSVEAGLFPTDMSVAYLSLPVRSDSGVPMRYTFHRNGLPGSSKADYQLSARPCPDSTTALGTSFFQVCRLAVQQSPRGTELDIEN